MEVKKYAVFAYPRFADEADRELRELFGAGYGRDPAEAECPFFTASISGGRQTVLSAIKFARLPFVDAVIPVDAELEGAGKDYCDVVSAIQGMIDKKRAFRIEAKEINALLDDGAKSVEVKVGSALEAEGFHPDLQHPETIVYVLLLAKKVLVGAVDVNLIGDSVLDHFRSEQNEVGGKVNRAEFKLEEAIEFFGIDLSKIGRALDVGAAPGGWTHLLATHGVAVVAMDRAPLDYARMRDAGSMLVLEDRQDSGKSAEIPGVSVADISDPGVPLDGYAVVHVRASSRHMDGALLKRIGRFGMLAIDTNTTVEESAGIAGSMAMLLDPGAHLVMTVKLFNRSVRKQVASAEEILSRSYSGFGIKKLPHNRDELTLHAFRKG